VAARRWRRHVDRGCPTVTADLLFPPAPGKDGRTLAGAQDGSLSHLSHPLPERAVGIGLVDLPKHLARQEHAMDAPLARRRERVIVVLEILVVGLEEAVVDPVPRLVGPARIAVGAVDDAVLPLDEEAAC